jgi:hypothetical protein
MEAAGVTCGQRYALILGRLLEYFMQAQRQTLSLVGSNLAVRPLLRRVRAGFASRRGGRALDITKGPDNLSVIRAHYDGGGGSRTRVRDRIPRSFYVRRALISLASGGQRTTGPSASHLKSRPPPGGKAGGPARIIVASGDASGGRLRKRAT